MIQMQTSKDGSRVYRIAVTIALICAGVLSVRISLADEIRLRSKVIVADSSSELRVRDVATLEGDYARSLGEVIIRDRKIPDEKSRKQQSRSMTVTLGEVRTALQSANANLGRLAITGRHCEVQIRWENEDEHAPDRTAATNDESREASIDQSLPGALVSDLTNGTTLRAVMASTMSKQWLKMPGNRIRIKFEDRDTESLALDVRLYEFELLPPRTIDSARVPVTVRIYRGDRFIREVRIVFSTIIRRQTLAARRYIQRGEVVRPGDLEFIDTWVKPSPIKPVTHTSDFVGREAMVTIREGQIIRVGDFQRPMVIDRHDEVTLLVKRGTFVVSMPGRALEEGRIGDVIRVQPVNRRNELSGRIESRGVIAIVE